MKKRILPLPALLFALLFHVYGFAQTDSATKRYTVAIFAPLYLDSAFDASGEYRYDKNFPRFLTPGLEFYEGIMLAADSLAAEQVQLNIIVFDTRSATETMQQQLSSPAMQDAGLIIGHVTPAEEKLLADAALKMNIPFVNANLPNDAGITKNPSLVILNSTMETHCEGIYRYLQRNHAGSTIIFIRKKGQLEDRLQEYFTQTEKNTGSVKLKTKYITVEENRPLLPILQLDSTRMTVLVVASLDENFGKNVAQQIAASTVKYPLLLVGMPTWEGITDFTKKEYRGLNIVYSTPFYNPRTDKTSASIISYFKDNLYARPGDMVFRGYECLYRFGKLLHDKGSNLNSSMGEKKYKLFTDWDIQPVLDKATLALSHFENKKLYFITKTDGAVKQVQ